jgi:hypothetical protein
MVYSPVYLKVTLKEHKEGEYPDKIVTVKDNIEKVINIGIVEPKFKDLLEQISYSEPPM